MGTDPSRRPEIGPVLIGRGDRRPFTGDSDLDIHARLARYRPPAANPEVPLEHDEHTTWTDPVRHMLGMQPEPTRGPFRSVELDELADCPRVYVFVHGWVPGSRGIAEDAYLEDGRLPMAWDERVANTVGQSMVEAYVPLLAALTQADPEAAVLWYSWVDQSGTDTEIFAARSSLSNTGVNGRRLAAALTGLIGPGRPALHLIGHSHGSVVATYAALSMARHVDQVTLLDCPEDWFSRAGGAAGLLSDILPRLRPGRGPSGTFVDAYASMFGRSYHDDPGLGDVVDVRLAPLVRRTSQASAVSQAHQYPVAWYTNTVCDDDAAGGFKWSPIHGFDTADLGSAYLATARGKLAEVVRHRAAGQSGPDRATTPLTREIVELTRRAPDAALAVTLPSDAVLVEFDATFERPGSSTRLDVAVDGHLAFSVYARAPVPEPGRFVRVAPGRTTLQFRLVDPGLLTTAQVSGLRLERGRTEIGNLDDRAAMARVAAIGAVGGAAATLAALGAGRALLTAGRAVRARAVSANG